VGSRATWFEFAGDDRTLESGVRSGLAHAGIDLVPFDEATTHAHGVVCFSRLTEALLQTIRDFRQRTLGLVMALAASPAAMRTGDTWRLLNSGAADTLVWDEDGAAAGQILARLDRWTTIDDLAGDAAARQPLIGDSPVWRALVRRVVEAAHFTAGPVLLLGESGTGKEVLARLIHAVDGREAPPRGAGRELVTVDCSTIVPELSGSELFGHERGAFTGAVNYREGAFALAAGGTLFLDEVGELPLPLQAQLLRAVQEKTYKRVGGNVWQSTDFRLVCATNRNLVELVERGQFRLDLYHRIAGWVFRMPTLRERREDIVPLARHFMEIARPDDPPLDFDPAVTEYLLHRAFEGNVRELRQLIHRIAYRHVGAGPVTAGDIPEEDRPPAGELPRTWPDEHLERAIADAITLGVGLKEISQATTETAVRIAVQSEKGNLQRAARRLGVTDRALQMRRRDQRKASAP
jgi:transcriptional regulator with GAF, ATPase, and Fis domain